MLLSDLANCRQPITGLSRWSRAPARLRPQVSNPSVQMEPFRYLILPLPNTYNWVSRVHINVVHISSLRSSSSDRSSLCFLRGVRVYPWLVISSVVVSAIRESTRVSATMGSDLWPHKCPDRLSRQVPPSPLSPFSLWKCKSQKDELGCLYYTRSVLGV